MKKISLNGDWTLQFGPQLQPAAQMDTPSIPTDFSQVNANVPGNVELDLMRAGLLSEDLERGNQIYLLRELERHQWWYSRTFDVPSSATKESCELVFDGVDTLASVWLNGERIGMLENMLIPHRLEVTGLLKEGKNELVIGIDSVVVAASEQSPEPGTWAMENNWESLSVP